MGLNPDQVRAQSEYRWVRLALRRNDAVPCGVVGDGVVSCHSSAACHVALPGEEENVDCILRDQILGSDRRRLKKEEEEKGENHDCGGGGDLQLCGEGWHQWRRVEGNLWLSELMVGTKVEYVAC